MDLGDLIFPLLIIGSVIVQWLSSRKGDADERPDTPPNLPPQPFSPDSRRENDRQEQSSEPSWDDLMEALGQPAAPPERPPVVEKRTATPPPVPAYQAPETPAHVTLFERQRKKLKEKQQLLDDIKAKSQVPISNSQRYTDSTSGPHRSKTAISLHEMLNNRASLRQAMVTKEILQPPVSLR